MCWPPSGPTHKSYSGGLQSGDQLPVEQTVLFVDQLVRTLTDVVQCLTGTQHVRPLWRQPQFLALTQAADAYLEKLVQVCRDDTKKLQPLKKRDRLVLDLMQNALIEFQCAEFPINKVLGQFEVWRVQEM